MLKSTMQDLADAVGVSRITVWKALNDREGVSPPNEKAYPAESRGNGSDRYGDPNGKNT